jgi:hypothetical protein
MSSLIKKICGAAVLGMLVISPLNTPASDAGMQLVKEVCAAGAQTKSMSTTTSLELLSPFVKGDMIVDGDIVTRPAISMQGVLSGDCTDIMGRNSRMSVPFYLIQTDTEYICYYQYGDQWKKISAPIHTEELANMMDPAAALEALKVVKDAQIVSATDTEQVVKVVMDGTKLAGEISRQHALHQDTAQKPLTAKQQKDAALAKQDMDRYLTGLPDIEYIMTVDTKTKQAVSVSLDLTPLGRHIANVALKQYAPSIKADQKEVIQCLIDSSTITVKSSSGNFDAVKDIAVPAQVLRAPEADVQKDSNVKAVQDAALKTVEKTVART